MAVMPQSETPNLAMVGADRQTNMNEAPAPEGAEATKGAEELLSPKYAALARKEKLLRRQYQAREAELKAREEKIRAQESEYKSSYIPKNELADRIKTDALGLMAEYGMSYDQLTNLSLNQGNPTEAVIHRLEAKIKELEEKQTQTSTKMETQQTEAYKQAVNQIRTEAKLLVDGDQQFEMIRESGAVDAVVELIERTFQEDGHLLSTEEAATQVETYLMEQALKLAKLNKIQQKLSPAPVEESEKQLPNQKPQQALKTLTNAVTASSSKPMSARERRERAILAFNGQLK